MPLGSDAQSVEIFSYRTLHELPVNKTDDDPVMFVYNYFKNYDFTLYGYYRQYLVELP